MTGERSSAEIAALLSPSSNLEVLEVRSASTAPQAAVVSDILPSGLPTSILANARNGRVLQVAVDEALGNDAVYRCVSTISAIISSLDMKGIRAGKETVGTHDLIRRPSLTMTRQAWLEEIANSLSLYGECFWMLIRADALSPVIGIEIEHPLNIQIIRDPNTGEYVYYRRLWNGQRETLQPWAYRHLKLFRRPGHLRGLGPIQANQALMRSALDLDSYVSRFFADDGNPGTGYLATDLDLESGDAQAIAAAWDSRRSVNASTPVLPNGLKWVGTVMNPKDALYVDVSQDMSTRIARSFGLPATIIDAPAGTNREYANLNDRTASFLMTTISRYTTEIESVMSELLPIGTTVEFDVAALFQFSGVAQGNVQANPNVPNGSATGNATDNGGNQL